VRRFAQLAGLSGVAIAQPLFDLLGRHPEFFSVRGASSGEILVFALALVLVPPAAFFALELAAGAVSKRAGEAVHLVLVGGLVAVFALEAVRRLGGPTALQLAVAAAIGAAGAAAFHRFGALRSIATVLAAAPVLFLALFLLESPASKLVLAAEAKARAETVGARTPVVLVVFDELPTNSLLATDRRIDTVRYPNFAALARSSTWFPNATTVAEGTTGAVPALLSGVYPQAHQQPILADHPDNLFTLLRGRYRIDAFERETILCPAGVCHEDERQSFGGLLGSLIEDASVVYGHLLLPKQLANDLPSVSQSWQDFLHAGRDEPARFDRFLATLPSSPRPTLSYLHLLLPHSPWQYLPSGERYSVRYHPPPWASDEVWTKDQGIVVQNWQRHLLQLAYADRLLGRLVERMRASGLWDRALVIVTGDEGISFRPGHKRRPVWPGNLHDIAFVPLFVKVPGQRTGQVVERHVPTMDVLPTIADVLGIDLPWKVDGRSVFAPGGPQEHEVSVLKGSAEAVSAPLADVLRKHHATLARQLALFGSETPAASLYGVGRYRSLLGRRVGDVPAGGRVNLDHGRSPLEVSGVARGVSDVAIEAGGRIVAVDPVYGGRFWALLPRPARSFSILAVSGGPRSVRLSRLRP
jgi:Sulfatase